MADQRNPFADRLTAYKPTLRDQARNIFANGGYEARRFAQNLFGSPGNMGLADWTPLGAAFGLEEAGRKITTPGQRLSGGADIALAMVPIPAAAKGAKKLAAARKAKPKGITAYHGSPHAFDQFDASKIGTGEGAQAYGHGLYFAEKEDVARGYRDKLAGGSAALARNKVTQYGDPQKALEETSRYLRDLEAMPPSDRRDQFIQIQRDKIDQLQRMIAGEPENAGHMYQVRINADPEDFLDWDKPLSQQPQNVRAAVANAANLRGESGGFIWDSLVKHKNAQGAFGEHIADLNPAIKTGPKAAMEDLRDAGVPGIKYLDAGSRGSADGTGSRNFVVFDPKIIDIMKRYGVAAPVAAAILSGQMAPPKEPGT